MAKDAFWQAHRINPQEPPKKPGLVKREQEEAAAKRKFLQSGNLGPLNPIVNRINDVIAPPLMQSEEQQAYRQAQRATKRQRKVGGS